MNAKPVRLYQLGVTVWGPGEVHSKHPSIELETDDGAVIVIADPYDNLLEWLDELKADVRERQQADIQDEINQPDPPLGDETVRENGS